MLRAKEILEASWWNWMVFLSFFFFYYLGKFYCQVASRFMIRFECKEYQSRNIPPLVYLGFSPLPRKWYSFCSFFQLCLETQSCSDEELLGP